ncbi:MAG TPA: putative toxin-antitoxin system toxin component, PIN family [Stellaceae bacterium]|nr:putative toxin-antitoxin system toxin component, PIN family [Stellaceae bacterium]
MRAVVDTNVLLSGFFWHGPPHRLLEQIRNGALTLVSSPGLLAELADVLKRPKFQAILTRSGTTAESVLAELTQLAEIIDPPRLPAPVSRDPDDDAVLAVAIAGQVDLVISGDDDLLTLGSHVDIPILDAPAAIAKIDD